MWGCKCPLVDTVLNPHMQSEETSHTGSAKSLFPICRHSMLPTGLNNQHCWVIKTPVKSLGHYSVLTNPRNFLVIAIQGLLTTGFIESCDCGWRTLPCIYHWYRTVLVAAHSLRVPRSHCNDTPGQCSLVITGCGFVLRGRVPSVTYDEPYNAFFST